MDKKEEIIKYIEETRKKGVSQKASCEMLGLSMRTYQRWQKDTKDKRKESKRKVANKLSDSEKEAVMSVACSAKYKDNTPHQIVAKLATEGIYIASESSFYRILREREMMRHRSKSKVPVRRKKEERIATGRSQLYSWDITYLHTNIKGMYYYLYLIIDVWSRYVVGWEVHESESSEYSVKLLETTLIKNNGEKAIVHSDNGSPMRNGNVISMFQKLGVTASFSRPRVSTDNAYSESMFKTLKYQIKYPEKFESIEEAINWVGNFVNWYNTEHTHSGIKYVTPEQRHTDADIKILERRQATYEAAKAKHPERWTGSTKDWTKETNVTLNSVGKIENNKKSG